MAVTQVHFYLQAMNGLSNPAPRWATHTTLLPNYVLICGNTGCQNKQINK